MRFNLSSKWLVAFPLSRCVDVIYDQQCLEACPEGATQEAMYLGNISLTISYCEGKVQIVYLW